mgnify:CR=1 FL=1
MSARARCPGPERLLAPALGLTDAGGAAHEAVQAHLAACMGCRTSGQELTRALTPGPLPFDPQALWPELAARVAALPPAASPVALRVHLRCTWCHDRLESLAVHCAGCLAPHHEECFREHGRCAAPGCAERRLLRPETPSARAPRRRPRWARPGRLQVSVVVGLGLAVLAATWSLGRRGGPTTLARPTRAAELGDGGFAAELGDGGLAAELVAAPAAHAAPATRNEDTSPAALVERSHDVSALLLHPPVQAEPEREAELRRRLALPTSVSSAGTPLGEVLWVLTASAGLGLALDPDVPAGRPVTMRVREVALEEALRLVLEAQGLGWSFERGLVRVHAGQPAVDPGARRHPPRGAEHPLLLTPEGLLEGVLRAGGEALGPAAWTQPAEARLVGTRLCVRQVQVGHTAVERWLRERALPSGPALRWFALDPRRPTDPHLTDALALREQLLRGRLHLELQGAPVLEALEGLRAHGVPLVVEERTRVRLHGARDLERVWLRASGLTRRDALELVLAGRGLCWDLERGQVLVRERVFPSREERLREVIRRELTLRADGVALLDRLRAERVSCAFQAEPLGDALDRLLGPSQVPVVIDPRVGLEGRRATFACQGVSLEEALRGLLAACRLELECRPDAVVVRPLPRPPFAGLRARREAWLAAPLAPGAGPLLGLGELWERLERSAPAGEGPCRVWASPELRAARVRVALPEGASVEEALDLVARQAGLVRAWTDQDGEELLLLLSVDPRRPSLRGDLDLLQAGAPWAAAPPAARAALDSARAALEAALEALAPTDAPQALRARLEAVEQARARLEGVRRGQALLAGLGVSPARRTAALAALEEHARRLDRERAAQAEHEQVRARLLRTLDDRSAAPTLRQAAGDELTRCAARRREEAAACAEARAALLDQLPWSVHPPRLEELAGRLRAGQAWTTVCARDAADLEREVARAERERLGLGVARSERSGIVWSLPARGLRIANVTPRSPAARAWLEPGDELLAVDGAACPDLLALVDALSRSASGAVTLRVARDGRARDVVLALSE